MEENKRTNTGGNDLMEDKLRELTEDTQVPASLEPEQIEKMLMKKKKEKTARYRRKYAGIAAAACLCLAVGVTAALTGQRGDDSSSGAEIGSETGNAGEAAEGESTESETKIASAADYDQIYDYIQAELKYQEKQAKKAGLFPMAERSLQRTARRWTAGQRKMRRRTAGQTAPGRQDIRIPMSGKRASARRT